ncbi:hypothetical protein [Desulfomonile tiedjei]|uniref:Uncharacterized protein n=1 Tax=Desulfomonile tiedjei (strain ATCC 49306 / DSM 6799 / DCB-1) TaxID=706587 RepID=I4C5A8_DESTA|nr:hypothetical protein [Desulfomonile tiedjei]AFM24749.1 hypothetical protein Desti_2046 [Desulfomonile tiedjei DSM 6799]
MKIKAYISVVVILAVGIFLVNASVPRAVFAAGQASTGSSSIQCVAPATGWCVPATAGSGVTGTFCANAPVPAGPTNRVVTSAETLGETIGSILAVPFVVAQCILLDCP